MLPGGYTFLNSGLPDSTGTLSGTIVPGTSITGTFTSDLDTGVFQLTARPADYNRSVTLASTAGTYAYDSAYWASGEHTFHTVTTGDASGSGSAASNNGCVSISSTGTIPDPQHNAYSTVADFTCTTGPSPLEFTALSAFFPAGSGAGVLGTNPAFTSDTVIIITDAPAVPVAYMIVSSKQ